MPRSKKKLRGISKTFPDGTRALDELGFRVEAGLQPSDTVTNEFLDKRVKR